ncbi:UMP kinase [bacterium]|nr:UMP kinase [bacterium]
MNTKRIVIKLSGEVFEIGNQEANLDFPSIKKVAQSLQKLVKAGYQIGVVIGAGNIFRARMVKGAEIDRVDADHMGMLATNINALALRSVLEKIGQEARIMSAFPAEGIMWGFNHECAISNLKEKRIIIFAGGTGNPFFTTDTTLVLRALEIGASHIFKASNIDGVYDKDPDKYKNAKLYKKLTYGEALKKSLRVMDATAFALARDNKLPLTVFKFSPANLIKAVTKNNIGTKVTNEPR